MSKYYFLLLGLIYVLGCTRSEPKLAIILFDAHGEQPPLLYDESYTGSDSGIVSMKTIKQKRMSGQIMMIVDSQVVKILSFRHGSLWGEVLEMYSDNNSIKGYSFRVDDERSTFRKYYDSTGKTTSVQGTPLVMQMIGSSKGGQQLIIDFLFANRIFSDFDVRLSVNDGQFLPVKLEPSKEYKPYKVFAYNEDMKNEKQITFEFEISTKDRYNGELVVFKDTLSLERPAKR